MKNIPTFRGDITCEDLGHTHMHEHLVFDYNEKYRQLIVDYVRGKLAAFQSAGGKTLVEVTPFRKIDWVIDICTGFDLNIILSTGYYLEGTKEIHGGLLQGRLKELLPKGALTRSVEAHAEMMERDITEGIDGSKYKAGIIKVAADNPLELSEWETKVFTAAAKASVKTKTPIVTHACTGQQAQQDVLQRAGADLSHVFYSHVEEKYGWMGRDVKQQLEYLINIIKEGSYIQFNNFAYYFSTPKDELLFLIRSLADRGYLDHVFISMDMFYEIDENGTIWHDSERRYPEARCREYVYIIKDVIPMLKNEIGFTEKEISTIFKDNPKRFFNWE